MALKAIEERTNFSKNNNFFSDFFPFIIFLLNKYLSIWEKILII